jgi:hypothetical protein
MEMIELSKIPLSRRKYFIKTKRFYPSGFGRMCPMEYDEPRYYVMTRPVGPSGRKSKFYGDKIKKFRGPFIGEEGKKKAKELVDMFNNDFHRGPNFYS